MTHTIFFFFNGSTPKVTLLPMHFFIFFMVNYSFSYWWSREFPPPTPLSGCTSKIKNLYVILSTEALF